VRRASCFFPVDVDGVEDILQLLPQLGVAFQLHSAAEQRAPALFRQRQARQRQRCAAQARIGVPS